MLSADLIIILAIAVFVLFKYREILGHKTGHDVETPKERLQQRKKQSEQRVVQLRQYQDDNEELKPAEAVEEVDVALAELEDDSVRHEIESIKEVDSTFTLDEFTKGAKAAFDMVMDAFASQDRSVLKMLLSEELYREFDQELKAVAKKKEKPHTTLVSILSAKAHAAALNKHDATLTIRFLSEQIHVVKDAEDKVIDGDPSRIEQVEDEWVFERNLRSKNPNWTITDM